MNCSFNLFYVCTDYRGNFQSCFHFGDNYRMEQSISNSHLPAESHNFNTNPHNGFHMSCSTSTSSGIHLESIWLLIIIVITAPWHHFRTSVGYNHQQGNSSSQKSLALPTLPSHLSFKEVLTRFFLCPFVLRKGFSLVPDIIGSGCQFSPGTEESVFFQVGGFDRGLSQASSVYTET